MIGFTYDSPFRSLFNPNPNEPKSKQARRLVQIYTQEITFKGDGVSTLFPIPFPFESLLVTIDGELVSNYHVYTGSIEFISPPDKDAVIVIADITGEIEQVTPMTTGLPTVLLRDTQGVYRPLRVVSDGTTATYSVPFPYQKQEHLKVFVDGGLNTDYWLPTEGQLTFNQVPPKDSLIVIMRESPTVRIVDFANLSMLNASVLDLDSNQLMGLIQEILAKTDDSMRLSMATPNAFDAQDNRITNVRNPIDPYDATNKDYVDYGLNTKVDKVTGKGLSSEDFTVELKTKLEQVEPFANNYVHPQTHSADMIVETYLAP